MAEAPAGAAPVPPWCVAVAVVFVGRRRRRYRPKKSLEKFDEWRHLGSLARPPFGFRRIALTESISCACPPAGNHIW